MKKLEEAILTAKWKSYKTFKHSGEVRLHTASLFREFHFGEDRTLTIKECKGNKVEKVLQTDKWVLDFSNKRHYLIIPTYKLAYEIITINHAVLVVQDNAGEKTFFAREAMWKDYLDRNEQIVL